MDVGVVGLTAVSEPVAPRSVDAGHRVVSFGVSFSRWTGPKGCSCSSPLTPGRRWRSPPNTSTTPRPCSLRGVGRGTGPGGSPSASGRGLGPAEPVLWEERPKRSDGWPPHYAAPPTGPYTEDRSGARPPGTDEGGSMDILLAAMRNQFGGHAVRRNG